MVNLSTIKKGRVQLPHFVLIYGVDGVGKSTLGASAPKPVFLGTEEGFGMLEVDRFPSPTNFQEVLATCQLLMNEKHDYKTLVIDSLDWLEPLVHSYACAKQGWKSIEDPGYGKGYVIANEAWLELINLLKKLRHKMNVVCIAHAAIRTFTDPEQNAAYDRYQLKLAGQGAKTDASALWREAVDCVFFANFEVSTSTTKGERKAKAYGDGSRKLYTERRPAFDAKNRFSLPFELELSWNAFEDAVGAVMPTIEEPARDEAKEIEGLLFACKGIEEAAQAFLVLQGMLKQGEPITALSEKHRSRILKNPSGFITAVRNSTKTQQGE